MPSLSEMRRWALGEDVEGLPKHPERIAPPTGKERMMAALRAKAGRITKKYSISADGADAVINFGQHSGMSLRDIVRVVPEGRGYLRWILKQGVKTEPPRLDAGENPEGFDSDLIDVVKHVLEDTRE